METIGSTPIDELLKLSNKKEELVVNNTLPTIKLSDISIKAEKQRNRLFYEEMIKKNNDEIKGLVVENKKPNKDIREKLKSILDKKFKLNEEDYNIVVDRYLSGKDTIDRETLTYIIEFINKLLMTTKISNEIKRDKNILNRPKITHDNSLDINKIERERDSQIEELFKNNINTNDIAIGKFIGSTLHVNENKINLDDINRQIIDNLELNHSKESITNKYDKYFDDRIEERSDDIMMPILDNIKYFNLVIDLIPNPYINGVFNIPIKYGESNEIENIIEIEFSGCFVSKKLYESNQLNRYPFIILKIEELEDNFYINSSNKGGFCQLWLEEKGDYYQFINKDKLLGIYRTKKSISLDKIRVLINNNIGNSIDFKYTDKDYFNIILKIGIRS